ncbi:hypothetical protein Bbelb_415420 [Branchiostoma belcheri]|nr:hypothetical protein Bbelb_415420 [Branchiostoma belcheri]
MCGETRADRRKGRTVWTRIMSDSGIGLSNTSGCDRVCHRQRLRSFTVGGGTRTAEGNFSCSDLPKNRTQVIKTQMTRTAALVRGRDSAAAWHEGALRLICKSGPLETGASPHRAPLSKDSLAGLITGQDRRRKARLEHYGLATDSPDVADHQGGKDNVNLPVFLSRDPSPVTHEWTDQAPFLSWGLETTPVESPTT